MYQDHIIVHLVQYYKTKLILYQHNKTFFLSQPAENFDLPLSSIVASPPAKSMDSSTTIAIMVHSPPPVSRTHHSTL